MDNSKSNILIVDDDIKILKLLKNFFLQNNFKVSIAPSISEAAKLLVQDNFDLIILDVMLPTTTGVEFAQILRSKGNNMPILMLTALFEAQDRIKGLEAGANDYLTKPFEPKELLLRVNNLINSNKRLIHKSEFIYFGNNYYDPNHKEFYKNNLPVNLSSTEEKLLRILLDNKNTIVSRAQLVNLMDSVSLRSIDVQITRLRLKIEDCSKEPKYLKTIRNKGYALWI